MSYFDYSTNVPTLSTPMILTLSNPNPVPCPTGSSCGCPLSQPQCAFDKNVGERRCMNMLRPHIPSMHRNEGGLCPQGDRNCGTMEICDGGKCVSKPSYFPAMG